MMSRRARCSMPIGRSGGASLSPDGRWLAYSSDRTKTRQLYVRSWPDLEGEILVSEGEANVTSQSYPQWSADGATL